VKANPKLTIKQIKGGAHLTYEMKIKTSELTGAALDWAVEKCIQLAGFDPDMGAFTPDSMNEYVEIDNIYGPQWRGPAYSTDWAQGGAIIEGEGISLDKVSETMWIAFRREGPAFSEESGPTPLIAAMRCFVASKLGDEVEVPDELTQGETK